MDQNYCCPTHSDHIESPNNSYSRTICFPEGEVRFFIVPERYERNNYPGMFLEDYDVYLDLRDGSPRYLDTYRTIGEARACIDDLSDEFESRGSDLPYLLLLHATGSGVFVSPTGAHPSRVSISNHLHLLYIIRNIPHGHCIRGVECPESDGGSDWAFFTYTRKDM